MDSSPYSHSQSVVIKHVFRLSLSLPDNIGDFNRVTAQGKVQYKSCTQGEDDCQYT